MCICIVYVYVYHVYRICLLPDSCHSYNLLHFLVYLLDIHKLYVPKKSSILLLFVQTLAQFLMYINILSRILSKKINQTLWWLDLHYCPVSAHGETVGKSQYKELKVSTIHCSLSRCSNILLRKQAPSHIPHIQSCAECTSSRIKNYVSKEKLFIPHFLRFFSILDPVLLKRLKSLPKWIWKFTL